MKDIKTEKLWQEALIDQKGFMLQTMQIIFENAIKNEFNNFIGAQEYERTNERKGVRNGTYERNLNTRIGTMTLKVCRDRDGEFKPELFDRYQRSEKALLLSITEMYISGVSTRKVSKIVEELCGISISKSQVSELAKKLDEEIDKWRKRSLESEQFMYAIFDARYEKIRENGRVISKAFVVAIGITVTGRREIIGTWVINSESYDAWNDCLKELKNRGLKNISYVVSDENKGLKKVIMEHFQEAQWQRCQVHFMRNFMAKLAQSEKPEGIKLLQDVFAASSKNEAFDRLKKVYDFLDSRKKESVQKWLEESVEDVFAVYDLPEAHRKKMRSTNMLERLNQELKRRSRVVRIFPNEQSCLRLLSALCVEVTEEWSGNSYLNMQT